jgi:hypothetical protein
MSDQLHVPAALPPPPRYPLDRRLAGPLSRSGRRAAETILDPARTRIPTPQSFRPYQVAMPTALQRLGLEL